MALFCAEIPCRSSSVMGRTSGAQVNLRAAREQQVGCAVAERTQPAVGQPANHRAAFAVGVERDFVMLGQFLLEAFLIPAGFMSAGEQRSLRGVANDFPGSIFEDEMGVVASDQDIRQFQKRAGVSRV